MGTILVIAYLTALVGLPIGVAAMLRYRSLPRGRVCPACLAETLWIRFRLLDVLRTHGRPIVQKRWCSRCGWEGVCRAVAAPVGCDSGSAPLAAEAGHPESHPVTPASTAGTYTPFSPEGTSTKDSTRDLTTVDLRNLRLDGSEFRVLIRCRSESHGWYGRLIFVDSGGDVRREDVEAFHGPSVADILAQALALSENSLARRLRQARTG